MLFFVVKIIAIASAFVMLPRWKVEEKKKSEDKGFTCFIDLLVWCFRDAFQQVCSWKHSIITDMAKRVL